ncbi:2-(1,2-epoxy-1,2-dihydrophenyl)acetyl-CoA isomerase [Sphingobium sp. OAS761]|uniref:enoyl-CoA hydratase/isomerase family protein n=1 Tax=Sphingobium sp. OAS761 TaxID=2817901 RepID=UPI00209C80F5|nr:enoyl-CoA hydratase-related protein [Sphingobium sp. OAS761]MCP1472366.1 2-(1,2-epoxy-1,2-dihydrophenyl)acetyl-CoA isomerase [Sphingobium sp. OAS761]
MQDGIDFAVSDGIARITLARPDVGNAIDLPLARALLSAAIACETDAAIRCVVLNGQGRLFCAGGDVVAMREAGDKLPLMLTELMAVFHAAVSRLARMPKPLLVLVNGPAAGAGFSLAMLGDVVLSSRSAHYTAAYGAIGLTADGGLSWLLPRLVGLRKAQEIILTNRRIKAEDAEAIGLVTRTVDDDALIDESNAAATALANAPVAALGAARALLKESYESGLETQLDRELRSMAVAADLEAREGLAAFFAKRPPVFRGA